MNGQTTTPLNSQSQSILVVGYGNPLRSDDGIGQEVANAVASWQRPNVEAIAIHQLAPELAEKLAKADMAIFVDAYPAKGEQEVEVRPLAPAPTGTPSGHWCEPQILLAIAQALYGYYPRSWWVMVPGVNFTLGDRLSPLASQKMTAALESIDLLIKSATTESCMNNEP
jgi:hydrogenase maturation protease